jgi:triacylglycerol lipase
MRAFRDLALAGLLLLAGALPASPRSFPRYIASASAYRFDTALAVEYGNLVNLAYTMNDRATGQHEYTPSYADLPSRYNFVAWIRMNDFTPKGKIRPKFYGIIVQRKSDPSSFILALRGTQFTSWVEWYDDFTSVVPISIGGFPGKVGEGFGRIFGTMEVIGLDGHVTKEFGHGFAKEVAAAVTRRFLRRGARMGGAEQAAAKSRINIEVTGHSLGSALATLYVAKNASDRQLRIKRVYTFASPVVGNAAFADAYNALGIETWRIANFWDWVPHLPPDFSYRHVKEAELLTSWFEVHADPGCWHSMQTYLHILDPSIAIESDCNPLPRERQRIAGH